MGSEHGEGAEIRWMGSCGELRVCQGMGAAGLWGSISMGQRETRVGFQGREPRGPPRASQPREMSSAHGAAPYPGSVTRAPTHAPCAAQSGAVPSGRAALGPPRAPAPGTARPRGPRERAAAAAAAAAQCGAEQSGARAALGPSVRVGMARRRRRGRHSPCGERTGTAPPGRGCARPEAAVQSGGRPWGCVLSTGGWRPGGCRGCIANSGGFESRVPGVASRIVEDSRPRLHSRRVPGLGEDLLCGDTGEGGLRARRG